jgi:hypothetical protein
MNIADRATVFAGERADEDGSTRGNADVGQIEVADLPSASDDGE